MSTYRIEIYHQQHIYNGNLSKQAHTSWKLTIIRTCSKQTTIISTLSTVANVYDYTS